MGYLFSYRIRSGGFWAFFRSILLLLGLCLLRDARHWFLCIHFRHSVSDSSEPAVPGNYPNYAHALLIRGFQANCTKNGRCRITCLRVTCVPDGLRRIWDSMHPPIAHVPVISATHSSRSLANYHRQKKVRKKVCTYCMNYVSACVACTNGARTAELSGSC